MFSAPTVSINLPYPQRYLFRASEILNGEKMKGKVKEGKVEEEEGGVVARTERVKERK